MAKIWCIQIFWIETCTIYSRWWQLNLCCIDYDRFSFYIGENSFTFDNNGEMSNAILFKFRIPEIIISKRTCWVYVNEKKNVMTIEIEKRLDVTAKLWILSNCSTFLDCLWFRILMFDTTCWIYLTMIQKKVYFAMLW